MIRALDKNPWRRFASADIFVSALECAAERRCQTIRTPEIALRTACDALTSATHQCGRTCVNG